MGARFGQLSSPSSATPATMMPDILLPGEQSWSAAGSAAGFLHLLNVNTPEPGVHNLRLTNPDRFH